MGFSTLNAEALPLNVPDGSVVRDLPGMWRAALDQWSTAIELAIPRPIPEPDGPLAFIDLATRQTHINFGRLAKLGVAADLPCVFAHEVGHHIRYPHTVAESRRMLRFLREISRDLFAPMRDGESTLRPDAGDWLLNLFFDLLINDDLVQLNPNTFQPAFVRIFRSLGLPTSAAFAFYLETFEELWGLPELELVQDASVLEAVDAAHRIRARTLGEFLRGHSNNRPLQLVRFLLGIRPFFLADARSGKSAEAFEAQPMGGTEPLDGDGIADLLRPRPDEEAARRWLRDQTQNISPQVGKKLRPSSKGTGGNPLQRALLTLEGLAPPSDVAITVYRQQADRVRMDVPKAFQAGDLCLPAAHESWDIGDDLESLDWLGSVTRAGGTPIVGQNTVQRGYLPDEPTPGDQEIPWIEIYVDSSGSMDNPSKTFSYQVLAGFILVQAATQRGGRVRIIQYSSFHQRIAMNGFVRAALPAYRGLVDYIGGGTDFPWDELQQSVSRYRRIAKVHRVIISDGDFVANVKSPTPTDTDVVAVIQQASALGGITGLLNVPAGSTKAMGQLGINLVEVANWSSLAGAAQDLARALFPAANPSGSPTLR